MENPKKQLKEEVEATINYLLNDDQYLTQDPTFHATGKPADWQDAIIKLRDTFLEINDLPKPAGTEGDGLKPEAQKEFEEKIDILIRRLQVQIKQTAIKMYKSGGVETEKAGEDFRIPMIIMSIILDRLADQHAPIDAGGKAIRKNLSHF